MLNQVQCLLVWLVGKELEREWLKDLTRRYDEGIRGWVSKNEHWVWRYLRSLWSSLNFSIAENSSIFGWITWFILWILACPFHYDRPMYRVAMVAEFELRQRINKQDLPLSKLGLLPPLNASLAKCRSQHLCGTALQWGSLTHLVGDWLYWTLSSGCLPSWERSLFVLSNIDIHSSKHFHVPMAVILPALLYKSLLSALFILMIFCTCFQTKSRGHSKCRIAVTPMTMEITAHGTISAFSHLNHTWGEWKGKSFYKAKRYHAKIFKWE